MVYPASCPLTAVIGTSPQMQNKQFQKKDECPQHPFPIFCLYVYCNIIFSHITPFPVVQRLHRDQTLRDVSMGTLLSLCGLLHIHSHK